MGLIASCSSIKPKRVSTAVATKSVTGQIIQESDPAWDWQVFDEDEVSSVVDVSVDSSVDSVVSVVSVISVDGVDWSG